MGKNRYKKKPYTAVEARKLFERTYMYDHEIYNDKELDERKRRIRRAMIMQDRKLEAEQADIKARGICPHCNTVRTSTRKCSMDCAGSRKEAKQLQEANK